MTIQTWTWQELCAQANSPRRARTLLRDGAVKRVLHGVYAGSEHPDGPAVRLAAVQRLLPQHAVLSGRAALWILGVDVLPADEVLDICLPRGVTVRPKPGLRLRSALVPDAEVHEIGDLLVVTAARVVVDSMRTESLVEAVALGDAALRHGATSLELIAASLDRAAHLRGVVVARAALGHLEPRSESLMESRLRMTCVLGDLPRPEAQVDFYDQDGRHLGRADLHLDGVVLEYDGRVAHQDGEVFGHDRRRHNGLSDGGLDVRRFSSQDYYLRPRSLIVSAVRRALSVVRREGMTARRGPDTLRPGRLIPPATRADSSADDAALDNAAA